MTDNHTMPFFSGDDYINFVEGFCNKCKHRFDGIGQICPIRYSLESARWQSVFFPHDSVYIDREEGSVVKCVVFDVCKIGEEDED